MKVLITGGAGYVGTKLAEKLLDNGHKVTILDNFMYGYDSILYLTPHDKLSFIKTDIRNEDISYLKNQDVIFHLAAISGYPACEANPNSAELINYVATKRISNYLSKDQIFIFASSTSLYGSSGSLSNENTKISPVSLYGVTKFKSEIDIMQRENSISLRWATIFGVSSRMRAGLIVHDFVEKAIKEGTLVLYSGNSKRTFMHINDSVKGYIFTLKNVDKMKGQIFNMGNESLNFSKKEIADKIYEYYTNFEVIDSLMEDKDVRHFLVDFSKARKLGYECDYTLDDGIIELIKLYKFYDPYSFIRPI